MDKNYKGTLDDILTEPELLKFLGISKDALNALRCGEGLPFLRLNTRNRFYHVPTIINWLLPREIILNKAEDTVGGV